MNQNYLPQDKQDHTSVEVLASLEKSTVLPLLPNLLEWLQDINWPIANGIIDILLEYKLEIIPHIQTIFSQRDTIWIYNILAYLLNEWDTKLISSLCSSLRELAQTIDKDDTDLLAIELLWRHRLIEAVDATHY